MTCSAWDVVWPTAAGDLSSYDPTLVQLALDSAQELLWSRSGRRYGTCTVTEAYRVPSGGASCLPAPQHGADGVWRNESGGRDCCRILLAQRPVRAVTAVTIDGVALSPLEYGLERNTLRRTGACFPTGGDCDAPRIGVTYVWGIVPPSIAMMAMGELAWEFLQGFAGGVCRLPSSATSIARQGVTVTLADPTALKKARMTGLPITDAFISSANPNGVNGESQVRSPDVARRVR